MTDDTSPGRAAADLRRGALAGLAGIAAWVAVMPLDKRLFATRYDDVQMLGMAFTRGRAWLPLGLALHAANGAIFGLLYARLAAPRLPGVPWQRGLLAASAENAALSTFTPLVDHLHPGIRSGATGRMATPRALAQGVLRHMVFGAVLGAVYGR